MEIAILLIGLAIGCLLCYFLLRPRLEQTSKLNENIKLQNNELEKRNQKLKEIANEIEKDKEVAATKLAQLKERIAENDKSTQELYDKSLALIQEKINKEENRYKDAKELYREEYEEALADCADALHRKLEEVRAATAELQAWKAKQTALLEAQRAEEERKLNADRYKIFLSSADYSEIAHLRGVVPFLRNPRVIYKMIWEGYFRTPVKELSDRIVPKDADTGIYKLTDLATGQVYIGQTVDAKKRFSEHCKNALHLGSSMNNKLYKAMEEHGIENFSFEFLEQCDKLDLNDREKFYIDYYQSVEYGLNEKAGGARV